MVIKVVNAGPGINKTNSTTARRRPPSVTPAPPRRPEPVEQHRAGRNHISPRQIRRYVVQASQSSDGAVAGYWASLGLPPDVAEKILKNCRLQDELRYRIRQRTVPAPRTKHLHLSQQDGPDRAADPRLGLVHAAERRRRRPRALDAETWRFLPTDFVLRTHLTER